MVEEHERVHQELNAFALKFVLVERTGMVLFVKHIDHNYAKAIWHGQSYLAKANLAIYILLYQLSVEKCWHFIVAVYPDRKSVV